MGVVVHKVVLSAVHIKVRQKQTGALDLMTTTHSMAGLGDHTISLLDPSSIRYPAWGRPADCEFANPWFDLFKARVDSFGGIVQPIRVRPKEDLLNCKNSDTDSETQSFELVFGYKRHRACLELGLPVLAIVEPISDFDAIIQFITEYRSHSLWRPWRLASALIFAMDNRLFPSLRMACEKMAIPLAEGVLIADLGRLPNAIRLAFGDASLATSQIKKLLKAYSEDPHGMVLIAERRKLSNVSIAAVVLANLTKQAL